MSIFFTSLNSGSNGNCYYIGNESEAVFVDAGISCRETEKRMKRLGLSMDTVKAVFVSHEHTDHISGIPTLAKKYGLPVYITNSTLASSGMDLPAPQVFSFEAHKPVAVGQLNVTAFPKFHDARDPHSFVISFNGMNVGVFTDIGNNCEHVIRHFKKCHAAFLEANYDEDMLFNGNYPQYLKKRISSGRGHLSNAQALELFSRHRPGFMRYLFLSHLSKENNCPNLVSQLFNQQAGATTIVVASRYQETQLYAMDAEHQPRIALPSYQQPPVQLQLSLF